MPDENAEMTVGERVQGRRLRRGMTRASLGSLVGRTEDWVKKIERNERNLTSLVMVLRLARALGCDDVAELMGPGMSVPIDNAGKVSTRASRNCGPRSTPPCSQPPATRKTSANSPGASARRGRYGTGPATSEPQWPSYCPT